MRVLLILLMVSSTTAAFANKKRDKLFTRIYQLDKALIDKDSILLKSLLHDDVTYGHSNGWIERKKDVIEDLYNGKLTYRKIENGSKLEVTTEGRTAKVLLDMKVTVLVSGKEIEIKLKVLEVWVLQQNDWKLFARQSVKVD